MSEPESREAASPTQNRSEIGQGPDHDEGDKAFTGGDAFETEEDLTPRERATASATLQADSVEVEGDIYNGALQNFIQNTVGAVPPLGEESFSLLTSDMLERLVKDLLFDGDEVEKGAQILGQQRVLCILGPSGSGRSSLALAVAHRLRDRFGSVARCRKLSADVPVVPEKLSERIECCRKSVVLLEESAVLRNRSYREWLRDLDAAALAALIGSLGKSQSAILITGNADFVGDAADLLGREHMLLRAQVPSRETVLEVMRKHLVGAMSDGWNLEVQNAAEAMLELIGDSDRSERFWSFETAAVFAKRWLPAVLRQEISLQEALTKADDAGAWLLEELSEDLEAFCSVLALTLCHASPLVTAAGWQVFDEMRRGLRRLLMRELALRKEPRSPQKIFDADALKSSGIELSANSYSGTGVSFVRDYDADRLWTVLSTRGVPLAVAVVPWLQEAVRNDDQALAATAAVALGRLGRLAPQTVLPLLNTSKLPPDRIADLVLGAWASGHEGYRRRCLARLRPTGRFKASTQRRALLAFYSSLRNIGTLDMEEAFTQIRAFFEAATEDLVGAMDRLRGAVAVLETRLRERQGMDVHGDDVFRRAALDVFPFQLHVLDAQRYCLVGLCLVTDPLRVVRHLLSWMKESTETAGPLLAWQFLVPRGVARTVDRVRSVASEARPEYHVSPLMLSLGSLPEAPHRYAEFLEFCWECLRRLPSVIQTSCRDSLLEHIESLAEQALESEMPALEESVRSLLVRLLDGDDESLGELLFRQLQRGDFFARPGSRAQELAFEVLAGA